MTATDLMTVLRRKPFQPFRIITSESTTYDVPHPDLVWVTLASAHIGYPDENQPDVIARYDIVALLHIVRVEIRESVAAQPPNGQEKAS